MADQQRSPQPMLSRGGQAADRPARHGLGYTVTRLCSELWLPLALLFVLVVASVAAWYLRKPAPPKVSAPEVKTVQPPFDILHGVNEYGVAYYFQKRPELANSRIVFASEVQNTRLSIWSGAAIETPGKEGFIVWASGPASGHEQVTLTFYQVSPEYPGVPRFFCSACSDLAFPDYWNHLRDL